MSRKQHTSDVDYTLHGLVAIVCVVLLTALFFAQPSIPDRANTQNIGGQAFAIPTVEPEQCQPQSYCDGTRLVRQAADCSFIEGFCVNGCRMSAGQALCE